MKKLTSVILCFIMLFSVSRTLCADIDQIPFEGKIEANGINIIEATAIFNNLFEQFKNTKDSQEKKEIFEKAKTLNDAFFSGTNITFYGYTEMLIEIERIDAKESTLEYISAKLLTYNNVPATVFGVPPRPLSGMSGHDLRSQQRILQCHWLYSNSRNSLLPAS